MSRITLKPILFISIVFIIAVATIGGFSLSKPTNVFFGDSITGGDLGVPSLSDRWTTIYCESKGELENNLAESGAALQKSVPLNPAGAKNMRDRAEKEIPLHKIEHGRIFICFGTNDVGFNLTNYTVSAYEHQLEQIIGIAIKKGWPKNKIVVSSPTYFEQKGRNNYLGNFGVVTAANLRRHISFVKATRFACIKTKVIFADTYNFMKSNGGSALLSTDGLHPNAAGHRAISRYMQSL